MPDELNGLYCDMADLSYSEKRKFEKLLHMESGYVLDFSNNSFSDFVHDCTGREIYDDRYTHGSGSKANRLRGFWQEEGNQVVGKLMGDICDYVEESEEFGVEDAQLAECRKIVTRLVQNSPVPELDTLAAFSNERDFDAVVNAIRDAIEKNEPEAGLDRLHTFVVKYVRTLCNSVGITVTRERALHSLFGEYIKTLKAGGHIESKMTERILKSSISTLEAFNDVRNNQSLAHDNPILNYDEALLIFNHVTSSVRFLQTLESWVKSRKQQERHQKITDESPF